jgi:hypothetical protein
MHQHHEHPNHEHHQHPDGEGGRSRRRHGGFGPGGPGGGGPRGRGGRGPRGRGPGGPGGFGPDGGSTPSADGLTGWLAGRLPSDWFTTAPEVTVDRDEVIVIGTLAPLDKDAIADDADATTVAEAEAGRITRFREETRDERIAVAREIEQRYGRLVAWGAQVGDTRQLFTSASVPVMTRLRQQDRIVLDTLVDAGVARSRSDALAWSVRLVGRHAEEWLGELREALATVEKVRATGPDGPTDEPTG